MTTSPQDAVSAAKSFRCPSCGGAVEFDVHSQKFVCTSCKSEVQVTPLKPTVDEYSLSGYTAREQAGKKVTGIAAVKCDACGGEIYFEENETAVRCPMCGSSSIRPEVIESGIAPEGVVPFRFDRFDAQERFRKWISKRWFAPNALKHSYAEGVLEGMYVPFWTYDADACADYSGQGGRSRTIRNKDGSTRTVVDWFPVSGRVYRTFDDILVCASRNQSGGIVQEILPYDTVNDTKPFAHQYLSGYKAERYSIDGLTGFETARRTIENSLESDAHSDILMKGFNMARVSHLDVKYRDITYKNVLTPMYVAQYGYGGSQYHYAINGETGKVSARYPKSPWKIALVVLLVALVCGLVFWLLESEGAFDYGGGGHYYFGSAAPAYSAEYLAVPFEETSADFYIECGGAA